MRDEMRTPEPGQNETTKRNVNKDPKVKTRDFAYSKSDPRHWGLAATNPKAPSTKTTSKHSTPQKRESAKSQKSVFSDKEDDTLDLFDSANVKNDTHVATSFLDAFSLTHNYHLFEDNQEQQYPLYEVYPVAKFQQIYTDISDLEERIFDTLKTILHKTPALDDGLLFGFYKTKAVFAFQKVTEWEMDIAVGQHLIVAYRDVEGEKPSMPDMHSEKKAVQNNGDPLPEEPLRERWNSIDEDLPPTSSTTSNVNTMDLEVQLLLDPDPDAFASQLREFVEYQKVYGDGWCTVVTTKIYARYQGGKGDKCSILAGIHLVDLGLVPGNHIMKVQSKMPHETTSDNTKQLLAKYAQEITQLKDLFADWNELDLLSQLEEEAGDIELVIIRITEGHATQWKQQKKQNKKQPIKNFHHDQNYSNPTTNTITATSAFVSSSTFDDDNNNTSFSASRGGRADGNSFTGIRGGRGAARGRGSNRGSGRGAFFNVNNGNELSNEFKYEGSTRGGRGGAIRGRGRGAVRGGRGGSSFNSFAELKSPEPLPSWDDSTAQSSGWGGESWGDSEVPAVVEKAVEKPKNTERKHNSQKNYKPNASSARSKTTTGTWAQLVKGPDLPSEPVVPKQAKPIAKPVLQQQQQNLAPISAVSAMLPTSPVNLQHQFQQQIKTPTSPVVRSPSPVPRSASPPMKSPSMFQQASPSPKQQQQEPVVIGPPGFKHQRPAQRVLNQDAAVVMPQNANLSSIGVKFGSLSVGQDDTKLDANSPAQAPSNISGLPHHPQQHPTGLQHFAGVSGFGFSNMQGNLPADYSALYGSDAQRAAMGYYADPSAYVNQAAGAKYPPEGATSTQPPTGSLNSAPQPGTAQQYMPQQQQYYYPYPQQYMQSNQFQQQPAYQSSVYPNQFVNKSMYPYNQPQQPTGSVAGSTAGAQAGAKGSTAGVSAGGYYGVSQPQHMYQQQPQPHHYDDITTNGGGVYGGAQGGFGFGGLGLSGAPSASKPQPGQGQDSKNQATRGTRQAYDNPQQNASAAATTTASAASSYYNPQQQMPVAGAGGYPFSAMHQGYQQQGQPQPGYSRGQQQGYWNGQS